MTRLIATTVTIDPQERYLSELGGFVFPCNEAAFEAMLDGVADRGGGGLRQSELGASLRKRAGAVPFNGTLIGLNR